MVVVGEERSKSVGLAIGEQVGAGGQRAAGLVERVVPVPAVAVDRELDPSSAPVERVAGQSDDVEGVHDRDRVRDLLGSGGLEPGEPVHRDDLDPVAPGVVALGEPGLERLLGAALDHVEQPCGAGAVADRGEVDDHRHVLVAPLSVPPDVLVDTDDLHAIESARVVDQDPSAFSQYGVVRGVPCDSESLGDSRDGEVLDHDAGQCPP
jgi:hypothetical protein